MGPYFVLKAPIINLGHILCQKTILYVEWKLAPLLLSNYIRSLVLLLFLGFRE